MKKLFNHALILVAFMFLFSCGKPLPIINDIDMKQWRDDRNGCLGYREKQLQPVESQKEKLLSLTEIQIVELLGRPDHNELYKRNQKFYYYFLEPSAVCKSPHDKMPLQLVIRFNAMGLAKEVNIES